MTSRELKKSFYFRFIWIPIKIERPNWRGPIIFKVQSGKITWRVFYPLSIMSSDCCDNLVGNLMVSDKLQNRIICYIFFMLCKNKFKMKVWRAWKLCILLFMLVDCIFWKKNSFFLRNKFYDISLALIYQMTTSFRQE